MTSVQSIRSGIDTRLATISGLRHSANMPGLINPPHAVVSRRTTTFDSTFEGTDDLTFAVTVFVSFADPDAAQEALDPYLASSGAKSVRAAIDGDGTLGGVVDFCRVTGVEADRITVYNDVQYLAADVVVEVG